MIELPGRLALLRTVWLLAAALLAATVLPRFVVAPDLVVLVVVAVALRAGATVGALTGLAAGWLVDLVPPGGLPLGATGLMYAVIGAAIGLAQSSFRVSALLPALSAGAASAVIQVVRAGLTIYQGRAVDWPVAAATVVCTAVVGALLVPPLIHWERRLAQRGLV
ncbi:rod shape-determining protein MreD [Flexivirga sp. ID2601S]|uniref:Rod shape-determining protein MreD n=1 Tax=Flexivirga aerilata TaxID=1656889 RepID=A0A849AJI0_9MICO|nr:rod shape-determining protein MreD [Flexivirga aerilata]NNG39481.1 rod shape-determining protein MreD [Flexivirga aerilata]